MNRGQHVKTVGRTLRMLDLAVRALLIPTRVRLGAAAWADCNAPQLYQRIVVDCSLMLDVVCDTQLAPGAVVLDAENHRGGFDEDLLVILAGRARRWLDQVETDNDVDDEDRMPNRGVRGNQPVWKGRS